MSRRPTYPLTLVRQLILAGEYRITGSAAAHASAMGFTRTEVTECVLNLHLRDFYKTMSSHMTRERHDLESCALCGGSVPRVRTELTIPFPGREPAVVSRVVQRCADCGESYLSGDEMDSVHRAAADIVREREGLLSPEEIRALRESMGLSQAAFERLIGAGEKTVVRWERGTIFQSKVTDTLMRVLQAVPAARTFLSKKSALTRRPSRPAGR